MSNSNVINSSASVGSYPKYIPFDVFKIYTIDMVTY
jgi:hypothetical protein